MYATEADVRATGVAATITTAVILAALVGAKERIDRYTGDTFETTAPITVRARLSGGVIPLPLRVQTVTAVRYADVQGSQPFPVTSFYVSSSATYGDVDAVRQYGSIAGGYDILSPALLDIAYEPVRSANPSDDLAVLVDGVFGWLVTPDAVHDAAVELALAGLPGGGAAVNTEGDADLGNPAIVPLLGRRPGVVTGKPIPGYEYATTGSPFADSLLAPYVRRRVRVS